MDKKWAHLTMRASKEELAMIDEMRGSAQKKSVSNITRTDIVRHAIKRCYNEWREKGGLTPN